MVFFVEGFLALVVENCFLLFITVKFCPFCRTVFMYGVTLSLKKNNTIVQLAEESL